MSNLSGPEEKYPFYGLMQAMDQFFQEKPVKHFFENLDEFFSFDTIPVRLEEKDEAYVLTAKLPGYEKGQIEIEVYDQYLTINARHEEAVSSLDGTKKAYEKKSAFHRISRTVPLPPAVDGDQIQAKFENGLLVIFMPKGKKKKLRIE
ncbi:Hsp20/alpha crystallin family protein [Heyndrickxia coagulans]|uniref:Hsp20/alpha crystallin family protein n=1 Tax=Heyndrickxia coagulans TaxID=1398 RepID=UPI0022360E0F|nr:Hsp20/alpha crystallin family protein [Heyndrickxia coagulans]UZH06853.1 Hsp20/alpha crystallin family protein [Heyndrickxia coagulans]